MRIYLASRYSRFPEMQQYAEDLAVLGHTVTSRWILGDHDLRAHGQSEAPQYMALWAREDGEDLMAAETVISFTAGPQESKGRVRGGRHVAFGMALVLQKRCIIISHREHVFHWLPHVERYDTWTAALAALGTHPLEQRRIQPVAVSDHEPTCVAALTVMAAHLGVSREQVHLALTMSCIPPAAPAGDWSTVLERALSLLTHPVRGYAHAL